MIRDSKQGFGVVTQLLHWLMVILLIGLFTVGLYMTGLEYNDALYHILPWWHKSFGLIVFFLLLFRFFWRLSNQQPEALETHKWWEKRLAHLIQNVFYLLILVICISGYIISTAAILFQQQKVMGLNYLVGLKFPPLLVKWKKNKLI